MNVEKLFTELCRLVPPRTSLALAAIHHPTNTFFAQFSHAPESTTFGRNDFVCHAKRHLLTRKRVRAFSSLVVPEACEALLKPFQEAGWHLYLAYQDLQSVSVGTLTVVLGSLQPTLSDYGHLWLELDRELTIAWHNHEHTTSRLVCTSLPTTPELTPSE